MINDNVVMTGALSIKVYDALGQLKEERDLRNLVVAVGKAHIAARLVGSPSLMGWLAVGSGATAPVSGDTALQSEVTRVALSSATSTTNAATFAATFGPGVGTGALTEAGIFNANVAGVMLARVTFSVVNKGAGDTMAITWIVTVN